MQECVHVYIHIYEPMKRSKSMKLVILNIILLVYNPTGVRKNILRYFSMG